MPISAGVTVTSGVCVVPLSRTYTLILSAPEEDWWASHAPSMEGTMVEAPDLGCPCVTIGELTTTWDTLRNRER